MENKNGINNKTRNIIGAIIIFLVFIVIFSKAINKDRSNINETNTNIAEESKIIEINSLSFKETKIDIDIKETKEIELKVLPGNANVRGLELCTSNNQIANLEKTYIWNIENNLTLKIRPIAEGNCEIFVKSENGVESNKVIVNVVDNARIEQEKKAKEEQARKAAEEQTKKQTTKSSTNANTQKSNSNSQNNSVQKNTSNKSSTTASNSNNSHGKVIYRTPTGKRYHFDPDCGGKNSYQVTLDVAISAGLTPCQKCAK